LSVGLAIPLHPESDNEHGVSSVNRQDFYMEYSFFALSRMSFSEILFPFMQEFCCVEQMVLSLHVVPFQNVMN